MYTELIHRLLIKKHQLGSVIRESGAGQAHWPHVKTKNPSQLLWADITSSTYYKDFSSVAAN